MRTRFILFAHMLCLFFILPTLARGGEELPFSRHRQRAVLLALLARGGDGVTPEQSRSLRALCASLVKEGGFLLEDASQALAMPNTPSAQVAKLFRQLDATRGRDAPARVTQPGALLLSIPVAMAYADGREDGLRAARHAAALFDDDPRAGPCAAVAYRLITDLLGGETDRRLLLKRAAAEAGDDEVARAVRASRLTKWSEMRPEATALGALERSLYLWMYADSFAETVNAGEEKLTLPATRRFLRTLAAATYGATALPGDLVRSATGEKQDRMLMHDLYDLARDGVLLAVPARVAVAGATSQRTTDRGDKELAPMPEVQYGALDIEGEDSREPQRELSSDSFSSNRADPFAPLEPLPALTPLPPLNE